MRVFAGASSKKPAYEKIQEFGELLSSISDITFDNIPQTFKHLQIRQISRSSTTATYSLNYLNFNRVNTDSKYHSHEFYTEGTSVFSESVLNWPYGLAGNVSTAHAPANIFTPIVIDIADYTSASKYKTVKVSSGFYGAIQLVGMGSFVWTGSLDAINSITIRLDSGSLFVPGSSFALYGIRG